MRETTDADGRIDASYRRAVRSYEEQKRSLTRAIRIGRKSIVAGEGDTQETARSVHTLEQELNALEEGWKASPLRRFVESRRRRGSEESERRLETGCALSTDHEVDDTWTSPQDSAPARVGGYPAVTNQWAEISGLFQETISAGAFRGVLDGDTTLNINHNDDFLLARTGGSLRLVEDSRGLRMDADLLEGDGLTAGVVSRIRHGILAKMSFAFGDVEDKWQFGAGPNGLDRRRILKIGRLFDVSIVTRPAYSGTRIWFIDEPRSTSPRDTSEPSARPRTISPARQAACEERLRRIEDNLRERRLADLEKRLRIARYGWPWLRRQ